MLEFTSNWRIELLDRVDCDDQERRLSGQSFRYSSPSSEIDSEALCAWIIRSYVQN